MKIFVISMLSLLIGIAAFISLAYVDTRGIQIAMAAVGCIMFMVFCVLFLFPALVYSYRLHKESTESNIGETNEAVR